MLEPIPDQVLDIQHDPDPAQDHGPARLRPEQLMQHLGLGLLIQVLAYILTLVAAAWIFPHLWSKPFLIGIEWNALSASRRWFWIIPLGVILSLGAQVADY